jgi:hypothetical protein
MMETHLGKNMEKKKTTTNKCEPQGSPKQPKWKN